jgi:hypothetical protein
MELNNMTRPMTAIFDDKTGENTIREMTVQEYEQYQETITKLANEKAEAEAKAQAKAELLERLGITADEAKLLLA